MRAVKDYLKDKWEENKDEKSRIVFESEMNLFDKKNSIRFIYIHLLLIL